MNIFATREFIKKKRCHCNIDIIKEKAPKLVSVPILLAIKEYKRIFLRIQKEIFLNPNLLMVYIHVL